METLLKKYIEKRGISITDAAAELGLSRQWMSQLVGGAEGGKDAAAKIQAWSKNEVPGETILKPSLCASQYYIDGLFKKR